MLYEVTLLGHYFDQLTVNRWNYTSTGTPAAVQGSFALASAFGFAIDQTPPDLDTPFGNILNLLSDDAIFDEAIVRAVYDVVDFYTVPFVGIMSGSNTGSPLSPVDALGFRTNRTRQDISRGTKRFAGVTETMVDAGGAVNTDTFAGMVTLAEQMSDILTYDDEGNTLSFAPCVVSKEKYTPEDSERDAYRYYATLVAQMAHVATGIQWQPYATTRSQTSRQYGHGA